MGLGGVDSPDAGRKPYPSWTTEVIWRDDFDEGKDSCGSPSVLLPKVSRILGTSED